MDAATLHHYKRFRAYQVATFQNSNLWINGKDQRQFTGGGAAYGFHAVAAFTSAKGTIHFRKTLTADVKAASKRSKAAKKAWATRRRAA